MRCALEMVPVGLKVGVGSTAAVRTRERRCWFCSSLPAEARWGPPAHVSICYIHNYIYIEAFAQTIDLVDSSPTYGLVIMKVQQSCENAVR
jgi:hypothetical protein